MKICIFTPHRPHFGNILTQLSFCCALRQQHPHAVISIYSKTDNSKLITECGAADELVVYNKTGFLKLVKQLRQRQFDTIYNLYPGSEKTHLAVCLSGAKEKHTLTCPSVLKNRYTSSLEMVKGNQYIGRYLLALLNQVEGSHYSPSIISQLASQPRHSMDENALTLIPGGGAGAFKRWNIEKYCAAATSIKEAKSSIKCINYILGPDEADYEDIILNHHTGDNVLIIKSPSIPELISIALQSRLTISNDCGPAHIFQMLEVPLIMIWGWETQKNTSPMHAMNEWFHSSEHSWSIIPNDETKSINSISVDKVVSLALAELGRNRI
ncbi:glycosyltransferase family 9 protein [Photobacterium halotolerans]|uniref:Uncharacterized protein n=1 Tax=Photobacterium halotolerans TaxID=265726 RepID=A0A0F5VDF6_9GAMM|nr:glycosyltransferase family 9 protein [Photobacterium halotolerans]KKD00103.1 hypothetical protein KY46_09430 [Photobacterium halotolerans]